MSLGRPIRRTKAAVFGGVLTEALLTRSSVLIEALLTRSSVLIEALLTKSSVLIEALLTKSTAGCNSARAVLCVACLVCSLVSYMYHSFIVQFSLSRMAKPRRFMPEPMLCLAERGIDDDDDRSVFFLRVRWCYRQAPRY